MNTQPATVTVPVDLPPAPKTGASPNGASPNGSHPPSRLSQPGSHRSGSRLRAVLIAGLVVAVAAAGTGAYFMSMAPKGPRADLILYKVKYEPVNLTVIERGALESADNRELTCRVRAGNKASSLSIKWVI